MVDPSSQSVHTNTLLSIKKDKKKVTLLFIRYYYKSHKCACIYIHTTYIHTYILAQCIYAHTYIVLVVKKLRQNRTGILFGTNIRMF